MVRASFKKRKIVRVLLSRGYTELCSCKVTDGFSFQRVDEYIYGRGVCNIMLSECVAFEKASINNCYVGFNMYS